MNFVALATDADGTLVRRGRMAKSTIAPHKRWRSNGRKLVWLPERRPDQLSDFPHLDLFDRLTAENGALLLGPKRSRAITLAHAPPARLVRTGIAPLRRGHPIIQTELDQEHAIPKVLRELKTDWQFDENGDYSRN